MSKLDDLLIIEADLERKDAKIKQLTAERDTYKQALDDLGVTPAEAKAGVARSKALLAERDVLKIAHQAHETANLRMLAKLKELAFENDKLKKVLEKTVTLNSFRQFNDHIPAMKEALAKVSK